jgi:aspartate/methionine/tyrosine aminotransferase
MSSLPSFKLEDYLSTREFNAQYMFCASDVESRSIRSLLSLESHAEEKFLETNLSYTTTEGDEELRDLIAKRYKNLAKENILSFAGAEEGIYTTMRVLLEKNDHVICLTPCYQSSKALPETFCSISEWPLEKEKKNSSWKLNLDSLRKLIKKNTKMIVVNFPNNPTGFIPDEKTFLELIQIAREHDLYLFSDEVYRGLELNEKNRLPYAASLYEKALSLDVMTKSYGLAGLRIGWIACQDEKILKKLSGYKHYLSICNAGPSEFLAKLALRHEKKIWLENRLLLQKNFEELKNYFLSNSDLFTWFEPQGGCISYPQYRGKENISEIADRLFKECGLTILPCSVFSEENNHFRVSFGRKNMPEALKVFKEFFERKNK